MDTTIVSYVDSLAKLGYGSLLDAINMVKAIAPDIWAIYVKQAYLDSIFLWVASIVSFSSFMVSLKFGDWEDGNPWMVVGILSALVFVISMMTGLIDGNLFTAFLNPEYTAIQKLLGR